MVFVIHTSNLMEKTYKYVKSGSMKLEKPKLYYM